MNNIDSIDKMTLHKLLSKKEDILLLESFLSSQEVEDVKKQLLNSFENNDYNLKMSDGIFFPFPYSSVHKDFANATDNYFKFSRDFNQKHSKLIEFIINRIEEKFNCKVYPLEHELGKMSELNTRILFSQKNGIDIHCENAFIHQLRDDFSQWLYSKVDLENSISFFTVLQKPQKGGNLVIYNQTWKDISFKLETASYEEKHDIHGSIFTNRNVKNLTKEIVDISVGEAIFFRAAQIWHGISKIESSPDRITLGCFLAEGSDGKIYYWA